jgi:hypothetical protein
MMDERRGSSGVVEPPSVANVATGQPKTTANCKEVSDSGITYKIGKPILSISFSLSKENPFKVNVGKSISGYKMSDELAYPIIYEIKDETDENSIVGALKDKRCIENNLQNDLAPMLTQLNSLLLDKYKVYYDTDEYKTIVKKQGEFLENTNKSVNTDKSVKYGENQTDEQNTNTSITIRSKKIKILIDILKNTSNERITNVNERLSEITKQNGVNLDDLNNFLKTYEKEVFPLYLLKLTYGNQQIFMTNNGIVTNGNVIFSYNDISTKSNTVTGTVMEIGMWNLVNDYDKAVKYLSGKDYDDGYIRNDILNPEIFIKEGGKRNTRSHKSVKHRITKRRH